MKRLLIVLLACIAAFAAAPEHARAGECGLPSKQRPLWIDFADGNVPYWPMFARPGVIAAAANFIFPPRLREMGAKTVYWEMNLRQRSARPRRPCGRSWSRTGPTGSSIGRLRRRTAPAPGWP